MTIIVRVTVLIGMGMELEAPLREEVMVVQDYQKKGRRKLNSVSTESRLLMNSVQTLV
jgi:hypothetical protein